VFELDAVRATLISGILNVIQQLLHTIPPRVADYEIKRRPNVTLKSVKSKQTALLGRIPVTTASADDFAGMANREKYALHISHCDKTEMLNLPAAPASTSRRQWQV
jgi:hypothetical protein